MSYKTPDLLRGSIKLWIMHFAGKKPSKEEVDQLAQEWESKYAKMGLGDFMKLKGYERLNK